MKSNTIDLTKIITETSVSNDTLSGDINKHYLTTEKIRLLSVNDVSDDSSNNIKKLTDFAIITGGFESTLQLGNYGSYFLRNAEQRYGLLSTCFINSSGRTDDTRIINDGSTGFCPTFSIKVEDCVEEDYPKDFLRIKHEKNDAGQEKHYVEMGEYPKSAVDWELNIVLENLFNRGDLAPQLKCTGRIYTTLSKNEFTNNLETQRNPEYEYNGQKYVRTRVNRYNYHGTLFDNGDMLPGRGEYIWVKVEPITFEITNWDSLPKSINPYGKGTDTTINLVSKDIILAGIPFNNQDKNLNAEFLWQNSIIRLFLNSTNAQNLKSESEYDIYNPYDFTNSGFLYEALNLNREPITEYTIPAHEATISRFSFEGCRGIKKIIIPAHVKSISVLAFDKMGQDTQIQFNVRDNKINLRFSEFIINNYKYIYVDKEGKYFTLSKHKDETLAKSCFEFPCDEKNEVFFDSNYLKNFTKLHSMKAKGQINFIPLEYTLKIFPASQIENYYINKNNHKWGNLVKELQINKMFTEREKQEVLESLMKIYYAIGGFSANQAEVDAAYKYILESIIEPAKKLSDVLCKIYIITEMEKFKDIKLKGPHNVKFAQFFMRYYKSNKDFMLCTLQDRNGYWLESKDYISEAHNNFDRIVRTFPNRKVTGNEKRALLDPMFVANHCRFIEYENVLPGNEKLAETLGSYCYSQEQFEEMQKTYEYAKKIKDKYVIMADRADNKNPIKFRVLEKDDPLGFVLGEITNCCQVIDGAGSSCVDDGYINPNAGFLVFEESILDENGNPIGENRILGQAYIWYDPETKTVCYDNIEIPSLVLDELRSGKSSTSIENLLKAIEESAESIMKTMNKNGIRVDRVTVGVGYNDIRQELYHKYKLENTPKAKHRGYSGYSDAKGGQFIIKQYNKNTKRIAENIRNIAKKAKEILLTILKSNKNERIS